MEYKPIDPKGFSIRYKGEELDLEVKETPASRRRGFWFAIAVLLLIIALVIGFYLIYPPILERDDDYWHVVWKDTEEEQPELVVEEDIETYHVYNLPNAVNISHIEIFAYY